MARRFEKLVLLLLVASFVLILLGGYVRVSESGLGCGTDWPTCNGALVPATSDPITVWLEYAHRIGATAVLLIGLATVLEARRSRAADRAVTSTAALAFLLLLVQAGIGALAVASELDPVLSVAHLGAATAYFGTVAALAVMTYKSGRLATGTYPDESREAPDETADAVRDYLAPPRPPRQIARDYLDMVKPGILFLLVVAGFSAMLLAGQRTPSPALVGWTLLGGGLAAAAASVFNNVLDREMDKAMARTRGRPLPADRVPATHAVLYGITLTVASSLVLWQLVNLLTAVFAVGGIFFYVVVYTWWLKPSTPQNIVIGGAAGGFPALVGWAAVTNQVGLPAVVLAALVFLWTPPHFWALAIFYREDYEDADVPMMPVERGVDATKRQMVAYSVALVAASLLLVPLGVLGWIYGASALLLGAVFVGMSVLAWRRDGRRTTYRFFQWTIAYLFLLFVAMVVDKVAYGLV